MDEKGTIFVEKTPFYATMGGQEGDTGVITLTDAVVPGRRYHQAAGRQDRPCGSYDQGHVQDG